MSSINPEITNCAERNDCEGIIRCISNGHPVDLTRADGRTALLVACFYGNIDCVKLLVDNGANIQMKNRKGANAISHAAYRNHLDIVEYLVSKGVDPNGIDNTGRNSLHMACSQGNNETIQFVLQHKLITDVNMKISDGRDALLLSIEGNCSPVAVFLLLMYGADVNATTKDNRNVLMESIRLNRTKLFHLFYRYSNININRIDSYGNTCLHYACYNGNIHIIKALLHRGAFVKVQNKKGDFPSDFAEDNSFDDCAELLEKVSNPPCVPRISNLGFANDEDDGIIMNWTNSRERNYYPQITAVEIQKKHHNKLFETWKTIQTIQINDIPFKDVSSEVTVTYEDGELTDIDSEDDLQERQEVENACAYMKQHEVMLDRRREMDTTSQCLVREYLLTDLAAKSTYDVRIRCANKYGWSNYSPTETFMPCTICNAYNPSFERDIIVHRSSMVSSSAIPQINEPCGKRDPPMADAEEDVDWSQINDNLVNGISQALEAERASVKPATESNSSDSESSNTEILQHLSSRNSLKPSTPSDQSDSSNEMMTSILSGGVSTLQALIAEGLIISSLRNNMGMSLLHAAAASASEFALEIVTYIIEQHLLDVNDQCKSGSIPLHFAIYNNNMVVIQYLLSQGSNLAAKDSSCLTPLLLAADRGNLQICSLLLENYPDVEKNAVDKYGRNALILAINGCHIHVADYLLHNGFDVAFTIQPPHGWNLLHFSIVTKNDTVVKYCLELGISPLQETADGDDAIIFSQKRGTPDITNILTHYAAVPDDIISATVLPSFNKVDLVIALPPLRETHTLFALQKLEIYFKKVSLLSSPTVVSVDIPKYFASLSDAPPTMVNVTLDDLTVSTSYKFKVRCSNINGFSEWKSGYEFSTAAETTADSIVAIGEKEIDGVAVSEMLGRGLSTTLSYENRPSYPCELMTTDDVHLFDLIDSLDIKSLIINNPEVVCKARSSIGLPPLHHCLMSANAHKTSEVIDFIDALLAMGCDINQTVNALSFVGLTPLYCACMLADSSLAEYLICNGADINGDSVDGVPSVVFYSLLSPQCNVLSYLVDRGFSIEVEQSHATLLHIMATVCKINGFEDVADMILDCGVDVNAIDNKGDSALHICVYHENIPFMLYLLNNGAERSLRNAGGFTAYDCAEQMGNTRVLEVFLNSYRVSLPPHKPVQKSLSSSQMVLRWEIPVRCAGLPLPDRYEVEVINNLLNVSVLLSQDIAGNYVFLNCPLSLHRWISGRVRSHNCNGWGEWSDCSEYVDEELSEQQLLSDPFYIYLFCHFLDNVYNDLMSNQITSVEILASYSEEKIKGLRMSRSTIEEISGVLPDISSDVLSGNINPSSKENTCFSWFK